MKTVNSIFLKSLIAGTGFSIAILITGIVYATISHVTIGDKLESTTFNNIIDATVPGGAVMSFNLATCPSGWTEYTAARGRFIRGIDSAGTNDTINRAPGNTQEDAFQGHWHDTYYNFSAANSSFSSVNGSITAAPDMYFSRKNGNGQYSGNTAVKNSSNDGTNGTPRFTNETRPKNVALLFCQKN